MQTLPRSINLVQGIALYTGALLGAGVLFLPGAAASMAGPVSLVAWLFDCVATLPLALTFAYLAARYSDAGGVSAFATKAFGPDWGTAAGWFYWLATATGQVIVPLTGAYYAAAALGLARGGTFVLAGLVLAIAAGLNIYGLRFGGTAQLVLSGAVALVLGTAVVASIPHLQRTNFIPIAPHGWAPVGPTAVFLCFAFFGCEAIAQLSAEFKNPTRDVPRTAIWSFTGITMLYLGVAVAVVGTGTYGSPDLDRTAIAHLLGNTLGDGALTVSAILALIIALGNSNAIVAASSRLGYALARDGNLFSWFSALDRRGVPRRSVWLVTGFAGTGLMITYVLGWEPAGVLAVPNTLILGTYAVGTLAGVRLLTGYQRWVAVAGLVLCLFLLPQVGRALVLLPIIAWATIMLRRRSQLTKLTVQRVIDAEKS